MAHQLLLLVFVGVLAVSNGQRLFNNNPDFVNGRPVVFVSQLNGPPPPRDNDERRPFDYQPRPPGPPPPSPENSPPPTDNDDRGPPRPGPPPRPPGPENQPSSVRYTKRMQYITLPTDNVRIISQADAPAFFATVQQQQPFQPEPIQQRLLIVRNVENTQFGPPPFNNGPFVYNNIEQRFRPNAENSFLNNQKFQSSQQQNFPGRVLNDAVPVSANVFPDAAGQSAQSFVDNQQPNFVKQPELILSNYYINFKHQFDRVNPRNPNAEWRWSELNGYVANKGTFVRDALSSVDLTSIPFANTSFRNVAPGNERLAALTNYEAILVNKHNIQLEPNQEVSARFSFTCKVFNVEQQPYPANVVSNAEDDPSLANCGFSIATHGKTSLIFSIVATNKGIWAVYERNRYLLATDENNQDRVFTIFHRLADRKSSDEIIDAAMTLDRPKNHVSFYVNGQKLWNVTRLGTLPQDEPGTLQHSAERPDLQQVEDPNEIFITFGLGKYMDEYDPNNPTQNGLRKQRLVKQQNYYDQNVKFYDNDARSELNEFGQGATMTLYDAVVQVKQDMPPMRSFVPPQVMLTMMRDRQN